MFPVPVNVTYHLLFNLAIWTCLAYVPLPFAFIYLTQVSDFKLCHVPFIAVTTVPCYLILVPLGKSLNFDFFRA